MTRIVITDYRGDAHEIQAKDGETLMVAARNHDVPGILGECGGCSTCATCGVIVDPDWFARVGAPGDDEAMMLECSAASGPTARLSCQITVTPQLDGLHVTAPEIPS